MRKAVQLGDEVKCNVTGFKGIATSIATCLNGCDRVIVQPPIDKDGKHPDAVWFDEPQLTVTKAGKVKPTFHHGVKPGGPPMRISQRKATT